LIIAFTACILQAHNYNIYLFLMYSQKDIIKLFLVFILCLYFASNPLGISSNLDKVPMHPYFIFKDLVTIFVFLLVLSIIVTEYPNLMGHSDNYIKANPMSTPASIVPEWYLLPFYAILRSIPNKLLGVIAMFAALFIFLIMPIADTSRIRGNQFRPLSKFFFWVQIVVFIMLLWIGSQHPVQPFVLVGQIATGLYFAWFIVFVPVIGIIENSLFDIALTQNKNN